MSEQHIKIGKDVLESLTTSMYEDHKSIYREYIQNACDQIDRAVKLDLLSSANDGEIYININTSAKSIEIEDNATGVKADDVYIVLGNVALSNKDRENERGFRGIGRLAGLGYCDELVFETSFKGENSKTLMTWNAKEFRQIIYNRKQKEEATSVIESVIKINTEKCEAEQHYFKVTLKNVSNSELLNVDLVREYLSMVAPLPMRSHFIYRNRIANEARKEGIKIDEYNIFVNSEQLYKPYSADIKDNSNKKIDEVRDVEFVKILSPNGSVLCWGWYGISEIKGVISKNNIFRYIRLRKGNIQIGLENALDKLHKEEKGNHYFIGELHAVDTDLIPNARRDYFSENETCKIFESKLKEIFHNKLYRLYRKVSEARSLSKKIDDFNALQEEFRAKHENGNFQNKNEIKKFQEEFERKREEAKKAEEKIKKIATTQDDDLSKIILKTVSGVNINEIIDPTKLKNIKPAFRTQQEYPQFDKRTQKMISKIYDIIDSVLPKDTAENLKIKIKEELA